MISQIFFFLQSGNAQISFHINLKLYFINVGMLYFWKLGEAIQFFKCNVKCSAFTTESVLENKNYTWFMLKKLKYTHTAANAWTSNRSIDFIHYFSFIASTWYIPYLDGLDPGNSTLVASWHNLHFWVTWPPSAATVFHSIYSCHQSLLSLPQPTPTADWVNPSLGNLTQH